MIKALVLRTCNEDMTSFGGFKWPESGYVECPDWDEKPECGNGLHGLLWGEGDGTYLDWKSEAKWLVIEIEKWIDLYRKIKFPNGNVVHVGDQKSATDYIYNNGGQGKAIVGLSVIVGNNGTAAAGDYGKATAGDCGKATAGDYGKATVGNHGIATVTNGGIAIAGDYGIATAGYRGKATAGYRGKATAGDRGTATAGDSGTATAGYNGTATAGDCGSAIAVELGQVKAGENGIIQIKYHDGKRYRIAVGYVGEDGIEPNVFYKVENGKFVAC